jgi:hypothetical protein
MPIVQMMAILATKPENDQGTLLIASGYLSGRSTLSGAWPGLPGRTAPRLSGGSRSVTSHLVDPARHVTGQLQQESHSTFKHGPSWISTATNGKRNTR